jgi:hypothetical protein
MPRDQADKLARPDDFRILPERGDVLATPRHEIIGACRVGALDKDVVVGVARHVEPAEKG